MCMCVCTSMYVYVCVCMCVCMVVYVCVRLDSYLDISTGEVVLGHDVIIDTDVICQRHARRVNGEDASLGLLVWQGELNLSVNAARADESGVKGFNPVGGHDDLDVPAGIEPVQLVE